MNGLDLASYAPSMTSTPFFNANANVDLSVCNQYVVQNNIDAATAQPSPRSFMGVDPPATDLPLPAPMIQPAVSTLEPSIDASTLEEPHSISDIYNELWPLMADDWNNNNDPPATDLPLPAPMIQPAVPTLEPSTDASTLEEPHNISDDYDQLWPLTADDWNNNNANGTYHCFDREGQLASQNQAPIAIAPKLPLIQQGIVPNEPPQSSNSTPIVRPKKRKRYDDAGRDKVKRVRKVSACFRCKIYKLSASGNPITSYHKMTDVYVVQRRTSLRKLSQG